jgi:carboxylesterase
MTQVKPGAEAWVAEGGDVGVLLLHGFIGSPASLRPLAEQLAAHGYTVELPRLPGHGTRWQDLGKATWRDWTREVVAALERLVAHTRARVVVGQSFGGCLALYLAETRSDDLSGLVLINPAMRQRHPLLPFLPVLKWMLPFYPGPINDIAKPGEDEVGYEKVSVRGAAQYVELQRIVQESLQRVTTPALLFTSREDHVVPADNSELVLDGIASDDVARVWLERSYHVATLDYDAADIERETVAFVKRVTA